MCTDEVSRRDCFLCNPLTDLVFDKGQYSFSMAGLGPIVPGYSIVATHKHVQSLADLDCLELNSYLAYTEKIRNILTNHYGGCLLTEHGKTPLCKPEATGSIHCFHPHFLLFPNAPNIIPQGIEGLDSHKKFGSLEEAIEYSMDAEQYLLLSPGSTEYYVIVSERGFPRQYARMLVAEAKGCPDLASWRDYPELDKAIKYATENRTIVDGNKYAKG